MGEKKRKEESKRTFIFERKNYLWMFIGLFLIGLGFILMSGGGSNDPKIYNDSIFSVRRIRIAPTLVLLGFGIEIYAILLKNNK
jgi:hypothetical protein